MKPGLYKNRYRNETYKGNICLLFNQDEFRNETYLSIIGLRTGVGFLDFL